jgi:hypothetical protein
MKNIKTTTHTETTRTQTPDGETYNFKINKENTKNKKQNFISKMFNGDKEIKKMRQQWELDLVNIQNNLDDITLQLEKLEKLCLELKNLLESSSNEECNFHKITDAVTDCRKTTGVASEKVKELIGKTNGYKLKNEEGYKKANKAKKTLIKSQYEKIINQTNLLSYSLLNNNAKNIDGTDSDEESDELESNSKEIDKKAEKNKNESKSESKNDENEYTSDEYV